MKKRLLSLALAATMLLGASMTVSAGSDATFGDATSNSETGKKDVSGDVNFDGMLPEITITVKVSTGGNRVIMNPYKLNLSAIGGSVSYNSMVLPDISFNNETEVPVALGISGYIDTSDNDMTVASGLTPGAQTTKKQVHVDVTFTADAAGALKLYSTSTARTADAGTPYVAKPDLSKATTDAAKATAWKATEIKNTPTLAKSGTTAAEASGSTPAVTGSDTVYLKFNGWCVPATGEQWPENALVKVVTKYNLRTETDAKCSIFK